MDSSEPAGEQRRSELLGKLEQLRQSVVICYVTSTRPGLDARMAMDVIPVMYQHLRRLKGGKEGRRIDLFLHSNGGESVVPWRLVTLIREYCSEFNVLIPHLAYSAATLTALGADTIVMHPMGVLGPTDPTVSNQFNPSDERNPGGPALGIAVEDVASYFALVRDDVGIHHEDELIQALTALTSRIHPLALGNVKRSTLQSRMLGKSLLQARGRGAPELSDQQIVEIVERLTSQLYFHGHPIGRNEARDQIELPFVNDATSQEEDLMWGLYEAFDVDMELSRPFNVLAEALSQATPQLPIAGVPPPGMMPNQALATSEVTVGPLELARVTSKLRSDVFRQDLRVTAVRMPAGAYQVSAVEMAPGWSEDSAVTSADDGGSSPAPEVVETSSEGTTA